MNRNDIRETEDEDLDEARRNVGIRNLKLSAIMSLVTLIAFVLFAIFASPEANETANSENRAVAEFSEQNGEIIQPIENNSTAGQDLRHFVIDDDGGFWVIEALLVPEEWKK